MHQQKSGQPALPLSILFRIRHLVGFAIVVIMAIVAILLFEGREKRAVIGGRIVLARWELNFF